MLENAKVTLSYKDFSQIIKENEKLTNLVKKYEMLDKEFEENIYVKGLDEIERLMKDAKTKKALNKKNLIEETLKIYCKVFNIPEKEVL